MKERTRLNFMLALTLAAVMTAAFALRPDHRRPNFEFMPDMAHQPRYNAFAANRELAGGQTLLAPAPGAVPRGVMPLHFTASREDALRAGRELVSPIAATDRPALARGKVLYSRLCTPCHGEKGMGDGPVATRGFPPPPSLHDEKARAMRDGQIFHILTYGQGNMPAYATQMTREDRWRVIRFLRSLQQAPIADAR